eukprot:gene27855-12032_t
MCSGVLTLLRPIQSKPSQAKPSQMPPATTTGGAMGEYKPEQMALTGIKPSQAKPSQMHPAAPTGGAMGEYKPEQMALTGIRPLPFLNDGTRPGDHLKGGVELSVVDEYLTLVTGRLSDCAPEKNGGKKGARPDELELRARYGAWELQEYHGKSYNGYMASLSPGTGEATLVADRIMAFLTGAKIGPAALKLSDVTQGDLPKTQDERNEEERLARASGSFHTHNLNNAADLEAVQGAEGKTQE